MHVAAAQAAPHPPGPTARIARPGAGTGRRVTSAASQAARLTKTTVQGGDSMAQLRLPRGGWYDTSLAFFQAPVPGPLRNRVISDRGLASTTEGKTPSCPM